MAAGTRASKRTPINSHTDTSTWKGRTKLYQDNLIYLKVIRKLSQCDRRVNLTKHLSEDSAVNLDGQGSVPSVKESLNPFHPDGTDL